jgi:hypothetical protein
MKKHTAILFLLAGFIAFPVPSGAESGSETGRHFRYHAADGPVSLHSDIGDEFTRDHARHARQVWDYFKKTFRQSPGNRVVLYYTKNQELYDKILKRNPSIVLKGARQVTANWNADHREWFILPYTVPDYGTQLHEMSHDFLYATYPASEDYPWFKEGSGMYYESGMFNATGGLVIERPLPSYHALFRDWAARKQVIPLGPLLRMPKNDFYRADYTKTYSQSMMLFFYLMEKHPATMKEVFAGINDGKISSNEKLIGVILKSTGKKIGEMEKEYVEYGSAAGTQ